MLCACLFSSLASGPVMGGLDAVIFTCGIGRETEEGDE
jgi:acetate kinase